MYKNIPLKYKLVLLFLLMAMIVAVTGIFGLWSQSRIGTLLELQKSSAAQEKIAVLMKVTLQGGRVHLLEAAMTRDNPDDFENSKIDYELKRDSFDSYCNILLKGQPKLHIPTVISGSLLEQRIKKVREAFSAFDLIAQQIITIKEKNTTSGAGAADDLTLTKLIREDLPKVVDAASVTVDDLLVEVGNLASQNETAALAIKKSSNYAFILVIGGAILLAVLLGLISTKAIVGRINLLVQSLKKGAEGDLTARVELNSTDELGRLGDDFNQMLEKLSTMLGKVKKSTGELGRIGTSIQHVSRDVIATAEVQQNDINETSRTIMKINDSQQGISSAVEKLSQSASSTASSTLNMARSIQGVTQNTEFLADSVNEVSSALTEMDASIRQIEKNATDLRCASENTASSIAEMDASIQEIEQNAHEAATISENVHKDAETGQLAVQATIQGIQAIRLSSQSAADSIQILAQGTEDIGMILSVIKEVTDQTRLLSLNASIIAAQSGEHGKGFAVVADEVRKLAERTSESTLKIDQLINRVQEETRIAVDAIQSAVVKVAEGEALSQKSGDVLREIVSGVEQSSSRVGGIARATREQARGSYLIRKTMENVADMVSQIAVSTHQQARASGQIMSEVHKMAELTVMVRDASKKQNSDGALISRLTEEIDTMIQQVREACSEQAEGGQQIIETLASIQTSTRTNLNSAKDMGETLNNLALQISTLENEVVEFKVLE